MSGEFTEEALKIWDTLSDAEKDIWTVNAFCQMCKAPIDKDDFNGSIYDGELALFHKCDACGNKEVRLIDAKKTKTQEIDDDFANWAKSKKEKYPDALKKPPQLTKIH